MTLMQKMTMISRLIKTTNKKLTNTVVFSEDFSLKFIDEEHFAASDEQDFLFESPVKQKTIRTGEFPEFEISPFSFFSYMIHIQID